MIILRPLVLLLTALLLLPAFAHAEVPPPPVNVLILDGRNNHDWIKTTAAIRATLENTGRFNVDVSTAPGDGYRAPPRRPNTKDEAALKAYAEAEALYKTETRAFLDSLQPAWDAWRPNFAAYDTVLLNYNGPEWPAELKTAFIDFVRNGGGVVLVHAANNAFTNWPEYNDMIGLGWRKSDFGTCVKIDDENGKVLRDNGCGSSGHGSKHPFRVKIRAPRHPIMKGLPPVWLHARDELYHHMRGPAKNLTILSSAFSDPKTRGTGLHEPVTYEVAYGKGRVVVTTMGHVWRGDDRTAALHCTGFQTILSRAVEYTATGAVTLPKLADFPTANETRLLNPELLATPSLPADVVAKEPTWKETKERNPYAYLSDTQARAAMTIQPGFDAQLVASAPDVAEPVLTVWDGNGAMYVAEMRSYMQDTDGTGTKTLRNGRIRRLVDTTGDGIYDQSTIFADNLNLPRMILPLDDRIAVNETDTTDIWAFRDKNGDGVADEKHLLYRGDRKVSVTRSVEHQDAGLIWNVDNFIYNSRGRVRYRFTNGTWETHPILFDWNQWGMDHDDVGHLYYCDNSTPFEGFRQPPHYWNYPNARRGNRSWRQPKLGPYYDTDFMAMNTLCPVGDKGPGPGKSFTSATGVSIFRGHAFPREYQGSGFVCDPTGHIVRRAVLTERNGRKVMVNPTPDEEFIVSPDVYFRPIFTATGPDGCLYITDIARGIIQDAPWVNDNSARYMRESGMEDVIQNGRIWRVRHTEVPTGERPRMLDESTVELLRHLQHPNGWWRDTAQKLIILRPDRDSVVPALQGMARFDRNPLARLHALWTLEGIGALDKSLIISAFNDSDGRVRQTALRTAEPHITANDTDILNALADIHNDRDTEVKRQAILSLGVTTNTRATALIDSVIEKNLDHEGIYLAAMTALFPRVTPLLERMNTSATFASIKDPTRRATAQRRWVTGVKSWTEDVAPPREVSVEEAKLIAKGKEIYQSLCISCHNDDGRGKSTPGLPMMLGPSLVDNQRVLGQKEVLNRILLHGMTGPVDGTNYLGGIMAPMGANGDDYVAAVLTYIRQEWGHTASPIWPADVAATRTACGDRAEPWTQEQLAPFALPQLTGLNDWVLDSSSGKDMANRLITRKGACETPNNPGRWFQFDLKDPHTVTRIVLDSQNPDRYPRGYELSCSDDGKTWRDPIAAGVGSRVTDISFEPTQARYFRVTQTGESKHHRWSIATLEVFGAKE